MLLTESGNIWIRVFKEDEEIRSMNVVFEPAGYSSSYQVVGYLGLKFQEVLLVVDEDFGGRERTDS